MVRSTNSYRRLVFLAAITLVLGLTFVSGIATSNSFPSKSISVQTANAAVASGSTKSFVIMITAQGFDDNGTIVVSQGDKVSITFIMDKQQRTIADPLNHHVVVIDGYNIKTSDINPAHPNATVTFTADQLGTFSIYCDTEECPIHGYMASASIEVDKPAASSSSSTSATQSSSTATTTSTGSSTTTQSGLTSSTTFTGSASSSSRTSQGATQTTGASTSQGTTSVSSSPTLNSTATEAEPAASSIDASSLGSFLLFLLVVSFLTGTLVGWRFVAPVRGTG